ncbi:MULTISPECIES: GntR family transcriptional regulator [Halocynthiibacter]|uniref:GntR family transcriptional regulator n=1 Tax=Halocynthiibacter halioticoli TaxID=2986804 RepID=A0AAE3IWB6_9RHOB|nr:MULTISPECIES: GntR family transcriptional regulator [Halocynthiibacter]MCV6822934.1 GntR family transcriptional regulator [Halocynthiibacter halioticoli]MCW4055935.1 GntR family transcriptional regulator [Halocynthiibacter sp. SDUM655004]
MTDMPTPPLTAHELFEKLELAIHEHLLAPGTKLGEDEIGDVYGVSRTTVRAALQTLSHQRLVEHKRNRGAFVAQPSVQEAREVFEARSLLEPRNAYSAAERATAEDIAKLQAHIDAEHDALHSGNFGRAIYLSGQFHIEIARISDQKTIEAFITQLISRSSLIVALYWQRRTAMCESHAHDALISAFADRDGPLAEELMKNHLLDLLTSLDLCNKTSAPLSLKDALSP